ncbi:MAG: hypothetical protein H6747_04060 [Deltaproteobacteria bacterium]|nr:hypothetical protein [Deltaproteobacteria bacterium]
MSSLSSHRVAAILLGCSITLAIPVGAEPPPEPDGGEVDWRGLERMDETGKTIRKDKPEASPVERLVQNAPYRVQVATSDATSIRITDAYTLERSRIYAGDNVHGYAFSGDGAWLYAVVAAKATGKAHVVEVLAIEVQTAQQRRLGRITLASGESLVHVEGGGDESELRVIVSFGVGKGSEASTGCARWSKVRRLRLRQKNGAEPRQETLEQPLQLRDGLRRKSVSPNTRIRLELGSGLIAHGRFGSTEQLRLDRDPVPKHAVGLAWMRDSKGVFVGVRRSAQGACDERLGGRFYRQPEGRGRGWDAWDVPSDVRLVRGDLQGAGPDWAPDGMRMVGVQDGKIVLVEPAPRFRGKVAVIAGSSAHWPQIRPGVRSLAVGAGALRHTEILLEQGDLEGAAERLERDGPSGPAAERKRLAARLEKLRAVRARRAPEFGVADCALSSRPCAAAPAPPSKDEAPADKAETGNAAPAAVDPARAAE